MVKRSKREESNSHWSREFEWIAQVAVPSALLIYVVGFFTNAIYLDRYGVAAMEFVKPQYIMTGLWVMLPLAVLWVIVHLFLIDGPFAQEGDWIPATSRRWWVAKLIGALVVGGALNGLAFVVLAFQMAPFFVIAGSRFASPGKLEVIWVTIWSVAAFGIIWMAIGWLNKTFAATSDDDVKSPRKIRAHASLAIALAAIALISHIGVFAAFIHPCIPLNLGGGRPLPIRFLVHQNTSVSSAISSANSSAPATDAFDVPEHAGGRLSARQWLILATSSQYIIANPSSASATEFDRSLVDGYVVDPHE